MFSQASHNSRTTPIAPLAGSTELLSRINDLIAVGVVLLVLAQLIFVFNFIYSMLKKKTGEKNPWQASTLEWLTESPPPHLNWGGATPVVDRGPYEYSVDGEDGEDYRPQGSLT